ncbi:Cytochrome c551 [Cognatishimia activa]|uniref:Cytochrome c551 n=2 Tax=Cognatishimia activa TaxID=1715691 RepID=A0A0P1IMR9_9RHOB|nr:Cytochrome c551 [Cognatishimia activa]CUK24971.1 Cytochrome c551 [Cognatishimia activa]
MMKTIVTFALTLMMATAAQAEGDIDAGKKTFGKCKSCHSVVSTDGDVLVKGGRTGPNLFGVIGREAGTADFKYSKTFVSLNETGLVWDEANFAAFVVDPRGFLKEQGTDGKTRMTFKLKKGGEDVAAFLASLAPAREAEEATEDAPEEAAAEAEATTATE